MVVKKLLPVIIGLLIIGLSVFRLWQITGCKNYIDNRGVVSNVIMEVEKQRQYDSSPFIQRLIHNKLTVFPIVISLKLLYYFDPRYLLQLIGPFGILMALIALNTIIQKRQILGLLNIFAIILFTLLTLISKPKTAFLSFNIIYASLSMFAIPRIISNKKLLAVIFILWVATIWFFFINWKFEGICNEVIF